jgi:ketosteroid isomerase-like protein
MAFDFDGFRKAYEAKDASAWLGYFAEDAEWIEYRHDDPPTRPNRMQGRAAIGDFIGKVVSWPIALTIEDPVIEGDRIAFRAWVDRPDGKRIIEHVMLETREGLIQRQIDVEAWD